MKVYVSELPKSCRDCPCMERDGYGFYTCLLYYKKHEMLLDCEDYKDSRPNECLLQSLAEHDKQVRKEVLGKLMNMLGDRAELIECGFVAEFMFTTYDLQESINEILGETDAKD